MLVPSWVLHGKVHFSSRSEVKKRSRFFPKQTRRIFWQRFKFSVVGKSWRVEIFCVDGILTRWVPYDGYIRHQNDHLSGRMTDISVMGEWQVAGVGGTRPLRNVLGEALEGRFSFEARNNLFSFQSYVRFEEFFLFPALLKDLAPNVQALELLVSMRHGGLFDNSAPSGLFFLRTPTTTTSVFWNFLSFFQSRAGVTCLTATAIPSLTKALWWWYVEN